MSGRRTPVVLLAAVAITVALVGCGESKKDESAAPTLTIETDVKGMSFAEAQQAIMAELQDKPTEVDYKMVRILAVSGDFDCKQYVEDADIPGLTVSGIKTIFNASGGITQINLNTNCGQLG